MIDFNGGKQPRKRRAKLKEYVLDLAELCEITIL